MSRHRAFIGVLTLAAVATACTTLSDSHRATRDEARRIQLAVDNSHSTTTAEIASIARSLRADVLVAERGPVDLDRSAYESTTLVLRLTGTIDGEFGGSRRTVVECWSLQFHGRFPDGDPALVVCPDIAPLDVPVVTYPRLAPNTFETLEAAIAELDPIERTDPSALASALHDAFAYQPRATVSVATVAGIIGITVTAGRDCVMARLTDPVQVWVPLSEDATAEGAGCSASAAAQGDYQVAPH